MTEEAPPEEPWNSYNRNSLKPGLAYPLRQGQVRDALLRLGVRVGHVGLQVSTATWTKPSGPVVWAHWPDFRVHGGGVWHGPRLASIYLWAVPTDLRQVVTELLLEGTFDQVCRWAGNAPQRGNAWGSSEHNLTVAYAAASLTSSES